jgi:hypothetical protein
VTPGGNAKNGSSQVRHTLTTSTSCRSARRPATVSIVRIVPPMPQAWTSRMVTRAGSRRGRRARRIARISATATRWRRRCHVVGDARRGVVEAGTATLL